jgi:hypothetical protein
MRDFIRRVWRTAANPLDRLWDWAKSPDRAIRRAKRWEALKRWAGAMKHRVSDAETAIWRDRQEVYRKREERARKRAEQRVPPTANTGCGNPGAPDWSGGMSICEREVVPVAARYGIPVTSRKRTSTLGNPSSDHYTGNVTAYAVDLGTFSGATCAHAIAQALGISGYSTGNYNGYTIYRCDHAFRVQILWAVSGHYNHIHVGVRRI